MIPGCPSAFILTPVQSIISLTINPRCHYGQDEGLLLESYNYSPNLTITGVGLYISRNICSKWSGNEKNEALSMT